MAATARAIVERESQRLQAAAPCGPEAAPPEPYRVEEADEVMSQLIQCRAPSELFVVQRVSRPRTRRPATRGGSTTMADSNAIAVLCMLGTKGSVSNLIQCTHALGQQTIHDSRLPVSDFARVFPHDRKGSRDIVSQGLLHRESFVEGLQPLAFFIHAIARAAPGPRGPRTTRAGKPSWRARRAPRRVGTACASA